MSIFDRDFSKIDAAIVASGSPAMIRNVLQAALDEIALLRQERGELVKALTDAMAALAAVDEHPGISLQDGRLWPKVTAARRDGAAALALAAAPQLDPAGSVGS